MKTLSKILIIVFAAFTIVSCEKKSQQITNSEDYNKYLNSKENKSLAFAKGEIDFWQKKFDAAPDQTTYLSQLASQYSNLFEITGTIDYLLKAESLLKESNETMSYSKVETIRELAKNYISQHRFKEAFALAQKANAIGEGMRETQKLLFDVNMELGKYTEAESNLNYIKDFHDFDYLIRLSKWNDHKGDIRTAITFLEKAKEIADSNNDKALRIWAYTNLADLNGHAGNIKTSYDYYIKTLRVDSSNSYALKGIAWIAFSYEKNTKEAKRILTQIAKRHDTPDLYLLQSKIAEYEKKDTEKKENLAIYFKMVNNAKYGAMYNKFNVLILADDKTTVTKALGIAKIEVNNRPTPDSYDLLAWSYYNLGNTAKAFEIEQKYVLGKSHEPILNYHLAVIYKANNKLETTKTIKENLIGSTYELGPVYSNKIAQL